MVVTRSESETAALAAEIARDLSSGDVLFLRGNLGAGKSVFARALVRALCGDNGLEVPSPTFTLVQTYETDKGPLWHFDLYRLKDPDEIYETGWEEALTEGIVVVEWPERLGGLAPRSYTDISITTIPDGRSIEVTRHD